LFIHENLVSEGVAFSRAECVMHVHWTLNQDLMKILCWLTSRNPTLQRQCY